MRISGWLCALQQTLGCFGMLWAMALAMGLSGRSLPRLAAAAMLGGFGALSALMLPSPLVRLAALLLLSITCPRAAFPHLTRSGWMRLSAAAVLLSFTLIGILRLSVNSGLPAIAAIPLATLCLPLCAALYRRQARVHSALLEIRREDRRVCVTAMVDSGNLLRDPLTGLPVIVCSRQALTRLLPLFTEDALLPGMRLLRVKTASGSMLMPILRPTLLRVRCNGRWQELHALIGLAAPGYTGWQALMPSCVLTPPSQYPAAQSTSQGG